MINFNKHSMKKGPLILLVALCALTMSVAANSKASRTQVCVVDDLSDTKVVKPTEILTVNMIRPFESMTLTMVDQEIISETKAITIMLPTGSRYALANPSKKEKIYLLNCSIRQCSYRTGAPV